MEVGKSVAKAILEMEQGDTESAMLHACNAVDGTAKKALPRVLGSNKRFTDFLRDNYLILGAMGAPGIDLVAIRFPVQLEKPKAPGGQPDLADIIYGIHRCCHGHGEALPGGFELIPDIPGHPEITTMFVAKGCVRLSEKIVHGLIATAVFAPANSKEQIDPEYYLTLGQEHEFIISEWWGRKADFEAIAARLELPSVKLDFGDWMPETA